MLEYEAVHDGKSNAITRTNCLASYVAPAMRPLLLTMIVLPHNMAPFPPMAAS